MTTTISRAAVLEIMRTPAASDTFPDMIRRVEALEGSGVRVDESAFMDAVWGALKADANDLRKQQRILKAFRAALEPGAQPETPTPGQFTTMCLAIEDVVTGRGFDVDPWQPIETSPKDGTQVLLHDGTGGIVIGFWNGRSWDDGDFFDNMGTMAHWMPLPKPPGETTSAIPEEVKAYLRNALMVGGWRGEI